MSERRDLVRAWFRKGDNDLRTAQLALSAHGPYDTGCFHCQQAVEKYLKGFLVFHGRDFPFTHDLSELALLCQQAAPKLGLLSPFLEELTAYAVEGRYDVGPDPTERTLEQALAEAERIRGLLLGAMPTGSRGS
jgi:HEPN domain-containing protein